MPSPWKIENEIATLSAHRFSAVVDLSQPGKGLREIRLAETSLATVHPCGLFHRAAEPTPISGPIVDRFVRQNDLFVRFGQTKDQPFSPSVYWTYTDEAGSNGVNLIASIQTDLLDTHPDLIMRTVCPAGDVLRLSSETASQWRTIVGGQVQFAESDAPHCLMVRLPDAGVSYAEMIHPADFRGATLQVGDSDGGSTLALESLLLTRWMEKGVILRARAQAVFVPREHDEQMVFDAYQRFVHAALPLTV